MKFGDSLWQRSVPQWVSYNVDYADIKNLIREHTTPGKGKAVSIPGHTEDNFDEVENHLYSVFTAQHARLNQFVKSKVYEINSRLIWVGRQIDKLHPQTPQLGRRRVSATERRKKCSALESEVLKTGQELQDLARFISVQRQAFRKLLKKYKKWSKSATLGERVDTQLLNGSESFAKINLEPVLNRWATYFQLLRYMLQRPTFQDDNAATPQRNGLDLDLLLAGTESNPITEPAVYWVHSDNIIELRVQLIQYMSLVDFDAQAFERSASVQDVNETPDKHSVGLFMCDSVGRFSRAQSSAPLAKSRDTTTEPCITVRWTADRDALVSVPMGEDNNTTSISSITTVKVPRKRLGDFLDTEQEFNPQHSEYDASDEDEIALDRPKRRLDSVRAWIKSHSYIEPLVSVRCRRTRFIGVENTSPQRFSAALDEDIFMDRFSLNNLKSEDYFTADPTGRRFPHALLSVRCESTEIDLIRMLDESHLTERVRGFSPIVHAVAVCCKPTGLPPPYWIQALNKDIRHIPESHSPLQRTGSNLTSMGSRTSGRTPTSDRSLSTDAVNQTTAATSVSAESPVEINPPIKAQKPSRDPPQHPRLGEPSRRPEQPPQSDGRYWSEYDHPEEGMDDNDYYIYIDPNAEDFPGQNAILAVWKRITDAFSRNSKQSSIPHRPFGGFSSSLDDEDVSSSDNEAQPLIHKSRSRLGHINSRSVGPSYTTFPSADFSGSANTRSPLTVVGLCLFAAVTLLTLSALLSATGRKKQVAQVDAGIVVGCVATMMLALASVAVLVRLQQRLADRGIALREAVRWEVLGVVGVVFVSVCFGVGALMAVVWES